MSPAENKSPGAGLRRGLVRDDAFRRKSGVCHHLASSVNGSRWDDLPALPIAHHAAVRLLEVEPDGAERCLTLEEWGTQMTKFGRDRNYGAGVVSVILACTRLTALWHAHDAWCREQCAKTDRLMRSDLGRRAARDGWICSLWDYCRASGKLPETQGQVDLIRAQHNDAALKRRRSGPAMLDKWLQRENRLMALTVRADEHGRVRMAS